MGQRSSLSEGGLWWRGEVGLEKVRLLLVRMKSRKDMQEGAILDQRRKEWFEDGRG